jgi:HPt (histidine-containing phosphotransfer) domain-containing protein
MLEELSMDDDCKTSVEIDTELISVVPDYLDNRRRECRLIEELLADNRFNEIQSVGHRMKGSGGSYGFDEISEIGEALETAAHDSDAETIRSAVSRLEKYLASVTVTYI